jgi:asparagine synthase (glutamine-hydrolysing)
MCGLAGIYTGAACPVDQDALVRMRDSMHSRGPDGAGLWMNQADGIGLAHRRLAILDLSDRGAQPMALPDRKLQIVFNGEIYNHPELRAWCESRGARYVSGSDTETILHLYALEGKNCVKRLRGMFAFALWDGIKKTILLARDPLGIKPLYYAESSNGVFFASQVQALLLGGVGDQVSPAGLVSFLTWGYVTEPHTWYRSIHPVPAGAIVEIDQDGHTALTSYNDPLDALRGNGHTLINASSLREEILDSVRHHLLADVPVGLFLSAGIDSGALCGLLVECADPSRLLAVTLGFGEYAGTDNDEAPLAGLVSDYYGCPHQVITYEADDFAEEHKRILAAMDQPTTDGVNSYLVSKAAARTGLKVALSGVGGDELFGGYPSFHQVPKLARFMRSVPSCLGKALRIASAPIMSGITSPKYSGLFEYGGSIPGAYLLRRSLFMPWEIKGLIGEDMARDGMEALNLMESLGAIVQGIDAPFDQVMALEHAVYLKNCLLRDADWAGMAHSLEIRTPLVDAVLFSKIVALRKAIGYSGISKTDFANTPSKPLPKELQNRKKTGFSVPVYAWHERGESSSSNQNFESGRRKWARALLAKNGVAV